MPSLSFVPFGEGGCNTDLRSSAGKGGGIPVYSPTIVTHTQHRALALSLLISNNHTCMTLQPYLDINLWCKAAESNPDI